MSTAVITMQASPFGPNNVPKLYWGYARQFHRVIDDETTELKSQVPAIEAMLHPRWKQRNGRLRREWLTEAAQSWRDLPPIGRLETKIELERNSLRIAEFRLVTGDLRDVTWRDDAREKSVFVSLFKLVIDKRIYEKSDTTMAMFSMHSIARRFERSAERSDESVVRDMASLILRHEALMRQKQIDFDCPVKTGRWLGKRESVDFKDGGPPQADVLSVRTFVWHD